MVILLLLNSTVYVQSYKVTMQLHFNKTETLETIPTLLQIKQGVACSKIQ
jgi:hypothetical protein